MKKEIQMNQFRQGDVFICQITDAVPASAVEVPKDAGRVILAYGEVTGHAHAIHSRAVMFRDDGLAQTFLAVSAGGAELVHEEHGKISIPEGNYQVTIQREYSPEGLRNVAD
jgi:hypothetical protein